MTKLKCPSCNSSYIMDSAWLKKKAFSCIEKEDKMCGMCGQRFKHGVKEKVVFT